MREAARPRRPGAPAPLGCILPSPQSGRTNPAGSGGGRQGRGRARRGEPAQRCGRGTRPLPGAHLRPRPLPPPGRDPPLRPTALPHPTSHLGGAPAYPALLYGPGPCQRRQREAAPGAARGGTERSPPAPPGAAMAARGRGLPPDRVQKCHIYT